jgi:lipopolysaccharide transport system ATP-binding protein
MSFEVVIAAEKLGKCYRVEHRTERARYSTLRDAITNAISRPFRAHSEQRAGKAEDFWALRDFSMEISKGEVLGVIGSNGAGKSTLLKLLSRITEPTEGRVHIDGRVASLLEVGTGFHPELTGRENIFLNGAILGMRRTEIRRKFDEIVEFAEVTKFLDTPVKRYSSGMYVRLAFAIAAHLEPEILVVDEVLAVGDVAFQRRCLGKMNSVAKNEGRTVLFVSHNMGAVRGLCETAVWLSHGRIVQRGPAREVLDQYLRSSLQSEASIIDLNHVRRVGGSGERMRLIGVDFNAGEPIVHGEPLHVRVDYEVAADTAGVAIGVGFSSLEGIRILTLDSDLHAPAIDLRKGTTGSAEFKVSQLDLQPGRYALDVAARSGSNTSLDYLPSCAEIEVVPGPHTPSLIVRESGGVRTPAQCTWRFGRRDNSLTTTPTQAGTLAT